MKATFIPIAPHPHPGPWKRQKISGFQLVYKWTSSILYPLKTRSFLTFSEGMGMKEAAVIFFEALNSDIKKYLDFLLL